jgi:hypothetical protein
MSGVEMGERLLVSSSGLRALLYPMFRSYPQTQEAKGGERVEKKERSRER